MNGKRLDRVSTGIKKIDELLEGGYPAGRSVLISGSAGTGKTIMGMHFANASVKQGIKTVYITTEEKPSDIVIQASLIGIELQKYIDNEMLQVLTIKELIDTSPQFFMDPHATPSTRLTLRDIPEIIPENYMNVVIDNIGIMTLDMELKKLRIQIDYLVEKLHDMNKTSVIICDDIANDITKKVASYSVYGGMQLVRKINPYSGLMERYLDIYKMRGTGVPEGPYKYIITGNGIQLLEGR